MEQLCVLLLLLLRVVCAISLGIKTMQNYGNFSESNYELNLLK
jgi:hypothetical protein